MISKTQAYKASDGTFCATLEEAQVISLRSLFAGIEHASGQADVMAKTVLDNKDAVLDILTTTKRSRPSRRLVNGYRGKKQKAEQTASS